MKKPIQFKSQQIPENMNVIKKEELLLPKSPLQPEQETTKQSVKVSVETAPPSLSKPTPKQSSSEQQFEPTEQLLSEVGDPLLGDRIVKLERVCELLYLTRPPKVTTPASNALVLELDKIYKYKTL